MTEQSIPAVLRRAASRTLRVRLGKEQAGRDYSALLALVAQWREYEAAERMARARWDVDRASEVYRRVPEGPSLMSASPEQVAARQPIFTAQREEHRAWEDYCGARRRREAAPPAEEAPGG